MWKSHKKTKISESARKMRKRSHNDLLQGNYQYINAFEVLDTQKKPPLSARKGSKRSRNSSVHKLGDDFFKYVLCVEVRGEG